MSSRINWQSLVDRESTVKMVRWMEADTADPSELKPSWIISVDATASTSLNCSKQYQKYYRELYSVRGIAWQNTMSGIGSADIEA